MATIVDQFSQQITLPCPISSTSAPHGRQRRVVAHGAQRVGPRFSHGRQQHLQRLHLGEEGRDRGERQVKKGMPVRQHGELKRPV